MAAITVQSRSGQSLHVHHWPVSGARGGVLISHGWSEHGARYTHFAEWLNARGYEVWAPDHQGHGRSHGKRGHVERWQNYAEDLERVRLQIKHERSFLIGHSMGGMIAVLHLLSYPGRFRAAALSGPAMDISIKVPVVKAFVSGLLDRAWPSLTMANPIDPSVVCSDPKVVQDYIADPHNHGKVSVRWFEDYQRTIAHVKQHAGEIRTPLGIWHGGEDALVAPWTSRQFFERLSMPHRHYEEISGARHEILNEPAWQATAEAMLAWLEQQGNVSVLGS